jgi:hypothetical protein
LEEEEIRSKMSRLESSSSSGCVRDHLSTVFVAAVRHSMGEILHFSLSSCALYEVNKEERSRDRSKWLARSKTKERERKDTWSINNMKQ